MKKHLLFFAFFTTSLCSAMDYVRAERIKQELKKARKTICKINFSPIAKNSTNILDALKAHRLEDDGVIMGHLKELIDILEPLSSSYQLEMKHEKNETNNNIPTKYKLLYDWAHEQDPRACQSLIENIQAIRGFYPQQQKSSSSISFILIKKNSAEILALLNSKHLDIKQDAFLFTCLKKTISQWLLVFEEYKKGIQAQQSRKGCQALPQFLEELVLWAQKQNPRDIEIVKNNIKELVKVISPYFCIKCEQTSFQKEVPSFQRCSQCKKFYYCSKDCQRADWPTHKTICRPID